METTLREDEGRDESARSLLGVVATVAGGGAFLYAVAGPPHAPRRVPSWTEIVTVMRGSDPPLEALAYLFTTAAWALWLYILGSLLLYTVVALAAALAPGAAWARSLRAASERVTLPIVRRLVDRAVVALLVVNLVGRSAPAAAAAPAPSVAAVAALAPRDAPVTTNGSLDLHERHPGRSSSRTVSYTVQPRDNLWRIAERFYASGQEYPRILAANVGRVMPDGRTFDQRGVIHPGWRLEIPLPSDALEERGGERYYLVEEGDMLRGIAARFLGDEMRWPEIFEANRGVARLPDGRTLSDPDLIWPGLRLKLPGAATPIQEASEPAAVTRPPVPAPAPAPVPTPREAPAPVPAVAPPPVAQPERQPVPFETPAVVAEAPAPAESSDGVRAAAYGAVVLGATAVAGSGLMLARRRARRRLSEPPPEGEAPVAPSECFADTEAARLLAHRLGGGDPEPAALVAEHALRFFAEHGLDRVAVVVARHKPEEIGLMLAAGLGDQERLLPLAPAFGARLGGRGRAWLTPDHDVMLQVTGPRLLGLVRPSDGRSAERTWLLPVGVLPGGDALYANWRALGHVLVSGLPGGGTDVVVTSLLGGLTARHRPEELELVAIGRGRSLPPELTALPHLRGGVVDPQDAAAVAGLLEELGREAARRAEAPGHADGRPRPELVLVVGDAEHLLGHEAALAAIGERGPQHGVRLLAATTQPARLGDDLMELFGTRIALQAFDDQQSVLLVGQPDASDLGPGDLMLRVDHRMPLRARGFRIAPEHLEHLVGLMREAYGARAAPPVSGPRVAADAPEPDGAPAAEQAAPIDDEVGRADEPAAAAAPPLRDGASAQLELVRDDVTPSRDDGHRSPEVGADADASVYGSAWEPVAADADHVPSADGQGPHPNGAAAVGARSEDTDVGEDDREAWSGERERADAPTPTSNGHHGGPLVEVQCLGAFVVRSGGREVRPAAEDYTRVKGWEVLAYLASHAPDSVTVDALLAAVWPDAEADKARNRMHTAMNRLRAVLREQVPVLDADAARDAVRVDRDGLCRLDPRVIGSDVHEFLGLCQLAPTQPPGEAIRSYERARGLYRGDLLVGRNARFFEWVHDREDGPTPRDRYAEEHRTATHRLARLLLEQGRPHEAIALFKELLKEEPTLEDVVQDLFRCHRATRDLGALVREERELRAALRRTFGDPDDPRADGEGCQPEPETAALFREICEELRETPRQAGGPPDAERGE